MNNTIRILEREGISMSIITTMEEEHYLEEFTMVHHGIEDHGFIVEGVGE